MSVAGRSSSFSKIGTKLNTVGTTGYLALGPRGTTAVDALYMTFITVATIGYGEVVDLQGNPAGRLFTIAIALAGIANLTYLFSTFTAFLLETNLNRAYRRRRMQADIDALRGHYIVCGAGRIGGYVIDELRTDRRAFVVRLTTKGRDAFRGMAAEHERWIVELAGGLSASERARLHALLGSLKTSVRAREPEDAGSASARPNRRET